MSALEGDDKTAAHPGYLLESTLSEAFWNSFIEKLYAKKT